MKIKSLLIGMLACSAMVACTNEDPIDNGSENGGKAEAYMAIRLVNANGTQSRGSDGNFEYGTEEENNVATTTFYFFKANGEAQECVTRTLSWTTNTANPAGNIEKVSDVVIALSGKNQAQATVENYNYVIAVLNEPTMRAMEGMTKSAVEECLQANTKAVLDQETTNAHIQNASGDFIMSNSTYVASNAAVIATTITKENILREAPENDPATFENAVTIYVERLAAKVKVGLAQGKSDEIVLKTVAEVKNDEGKVTTEAKDVEVNGQDAELTVKILGWGLNATAKKSHIVKQIKATWETKDTGLGFDWIGATNTYRTFWGKSYNYGLPSSTVVYPKNFEAASGTAENKGTNVKTDATTQPLNYFSWNELASTMDGVEYCAENTNTADVLMQEGIFHSAVTHILVKAQITKLKIGDKTVENPTLYRYYSKLYTDADFKARVMSEVNYPVYTNNDGEITKVDWTEYLTVTNKYDGKVTLTFTMPKGVTWFTDKEGETPYDATTNPIATRLAALDNDGDAVPNEGPIADCYNQGKMYYNVPIKHLRGGEYAYEANKEGAEVLTVKEADYGVVRNHLYNLTINKVENLGKAVFDPYEDIIPPTSSGQTYYLGAQINILSWKVVNQGVNL